MSKEIKKTNIANGWELGGLLLSSQEEKVKSMEKREKNGRVKYLSKIFDFNDPETYDNLFDGERAATFLYDLVSLGFVKKSKLIALLDEDCVFDEALDNMAGDEFEEWWDGGEAEAEGLKGSF